MTPARTLPTHASIIPYYGGKSYLSPRIVALMPSHTRYIEPFFGGGSVLFHKPRVAYEVVNDLDRHVTTFFQTLRDQPAELIAQLWATPYSREEFATALIDAINLSPIETARGFFIRQNMGFSGSAQSPGDWGVAHGLDRNLPKYVSKWQTHLALLAGVADRLRQTIIEHQDFEQVIRRYVVPDHDVGATLIYADPPYVASTRAGNPAAYRHEMSDADHERLLKLLMAIPAMVLLSGYDCDLYRDTLSGWECVCWHVTARAAGHSKTGKAQPTRVECLWRNPAAVSALTCQMTLFGGIASEAMP